MKDAKELYENCQEFHKKIPRILEKKSPRINFTKKFQKAIQFFRELFSFLSFALLKHRVGTCTSCWVGKI